MFVMGVFAVSALVLAAAGHAIRLAAAIAAAGQAGSILFAVAPADPVTIGAVATLTMTIALVACLVPAWRASGTEPLAALKE